MSERERQLECSSARMRRMLLAATVLSGLLGGGLWWWLDSERQRIEAERLRSESALMQAQRLIETYRTLPPEVTAERSELATGVQ